jgi:RNA recognition motif-containing protein
LIYSPSLLEWKPTPKGYGFVLFETQEQANAALAMDNTELDGRTLIVTIAKKKSKEE